MILKRPKLNIRQLDQKRKGIRGLVEGSLFENKSEKSLQNRLLWQTREQDR